MIAIVGNNDGPLVLLRSLQKVGITDVCVGLQKPATPELAQQYQPYVSDDHFFSEFNEAKLLVKLQTFPVSLLINCFCNFKFVKLLEQYPTLNVHLAPLPHYRGRHPLHWALINGESEFGVTVHRMTAEIDGGDIYWQKMVSVDEGMSVQALRKRLMEALEADFGGFLLQYQQQAIVGLPNRDAEATYIARRYPADSQLTEWHNRDIIYRKVMALREESNLAYLLVEGQTIPVRRAALGKKKYVGLARPFICQVLVGGVEVVCGDGRTVVLEGFDPKGYSMKLNQRVR